MAERNVLICGAGLMGHGIGQAMAAAAHNVVLFEPEMARAGAGRARREILTEVAASAPATAVLASNTSSISITRLAAALPRERRARFVGMHFFSPVPVMPLIELVRGAETDDATEAYVREIAAEL